MPYTLSMALLWVSLAFALGIVVGWLLRHVVAKRQVERARSHHVDTAELDRLRARVATLEAATAQGARQGDEPVERAAPPAASPAADLPDAPEIDLERAAVVLGRHVDLDDLTLVEGIGPKISELCHGIGIRSWADLAATEASLLRTMLSDAGPRFRVHDPSTWPEQAALLTAGRWADFKELTDRLAGGRSDGGTATGTP